MARVASKAAQRAVALAESQYQVGLTDFTSILDAQRSLLSFQEQLAQSEGAVTSNLVRLYKALGGGCWVPSKGVLKRKSDLLDRFPYFLAQLQHKILRGFFSFPQFFHKECIFKISFS